MKPTPSTAATLAVLLCCRLFTSAAAVAEAGPVGVFARHEDIGACGRLGGVTYDPSAQTYTVTGGGENMIDS